MKNVSSVILTFVIFISKSYIVNIRHGAYTKNRIESLTREHGKSRILKL